MPNAEFLLHDQFIEYVLDGALRRALKRYIRLNPAARGDAMRWELEGLPAGIRGQSNAVPSAFGFQCAVRGDPLKVTGHAQTEVNEMKELLKQQQLN